MASSFLLDAEEKRRSLSFLSLDAFAAMNGRSDRVQSSQQVNSETQESSNEDFFDQFFLNLPWADLGYGNSKASPEYPFEGGEAVQLHQLCDESLLLASRLRQNQIAGIPRNVNPGDSTLLLGGSRNDAEPTFKLPGPPVRVFSLSLSLSLVFLSKQLLNFPGRGSIFPGHIPAIWHRASAL